MAVASARGSGHHGRQISQLEEEVCLKRAVEEARKEAFSAIKEEETQRLALENAAEKAKPVIFKDGTGRKSCLPIESCRTWQVSSCSPYRSSGMLTV